MKAVILERFALHEGDMNWLPLQALVQKVESWPRTRQEEAAARLAGAEIAVLNKVKVTEALLYACPQLRLVCVTATGVDNIDLAACRRHGVTVCNVPGYSTQSVAQHTMMLLLNLCQCAGPFDAAVRAGHWQVGIPAEFGILPLRELFQKQLGLVGFGAIAQQVARAAQAFGMQVLCHTRTMRPEYDDLGVRFVDLPTLLRESDAISLHCPATPETQGLLNAQTLALLRPGCLVVNTARGVLVDEPAMTAALHSGKVGGYAADVVSAEPIAPENPLLHAPHVLLTPHIAWATPEALARLANAVIENIAAYLQGNAQNVIKLAKS